MAVVETAESVVVAAVVGVEGAVGRRVDAQASNGGVSAVGPAGAVAGTAAGSVTVV